MNTTEALRIERLENALKEIDRTAMIHRAHGDVSDSYEVVMDLQKTAREALEEE